MVETLETNDAWRAQLRNDFDRLARRHRQRVYRVCMRVVSDPQRAEELTQDALMTAFAQIDRFEGRAAFSTWVCGIAKNLALNEVRRRRETLTEDGVLEASDPGLAALRDLRRQEREELMRQAAADVLDPVEQEVVYLRYSEQLSRTAIAEVLELDSDNQVRVVLQRCRRRLERGLRHRLEQLGHGTSFIRTSW